MSVVTEQKAVSVKPRGQEKIRFRLPSAAILGVLPFFAYVAILLVVPTLYLVVGAFQSQSGGFTIQNVTELLQSQYLNAYLTSVEVSGITAVVGALFGLFVAAAAISEGIPRWIRQLLSTFSGVAANFAGIPLAFAFIATLGLNGVATILLKDMGLDIYKMGFTLFSLAGLSITYIYFQLPLMILVILPTLDGLRKEWHEAAANLGASRLQFWLHIGLPILMPSFLASLVLLFGNAFSAYATPYALTSGYLNIVTVLIGSVLNGNVTASPQLGDALAFGMIVIVAATMFVYGILQRRAERWLRR